nr:hypothetical protein [Tanacetum cinerariifolium]
FGQDHMGGRFVAIGTIPVCCRSTRRLGRGSGFWWDNWIKGFSPSGDFGKFTLLVPGLCLLSFEGWIRPCDDAEPQPQSSHVVHAGTNLEHMDLEATDVSTQLHPKQMDEGFTATSYPNV